MLLFMFSFVLHKTPKQATSIIMLQHKLQVFIYFLLFLISSVEAQQPSYTYSYAGPTGLNGDHVLITFTVTSPLLPSKSYITKASAAAIGDSICVITSSGTPRSTFPSLSLQTFQIHTDALGKLDSWDLLGDLSALSGSPMSGVHYQAYSMNTMAFIPGSDIPGASGLVTGRYMYDQATITTFYTSCSQAPPGSQCSLAGNGQPYVGDYSFIVNPSNTNGSWWKTTTNPNGGAGASLCDTAGSPSLFASPASSPAASPSPVAPPSASPVTPPSPSPSRSPSSPSPVAKSSSPSKSRAASPSPSAASPSRTPSSSRSPSRSRSPSKTPTAASPSKSPATWLPASPSPLADPPCIGSPDASGKGAVIGLGYHTLTLTGPVLVKVPACASVTYNGGATAFAMGQSIEWEGYSSSAYGNVANIVVVN